DIFVDLADKVGEAGKYLKGEKGAFIPSKFRRKQQQDDADIAAGRLQPIVVATQPMDGESWGIYRYYLDPVHTLLKIPRPEYGQLANNIMLSTNKEAQFQKQATDSLTGTKKPDGPDSAIADKLMRFAV